MEKQPDIPPSQKETPAKKKPVVLSIISIIILGFAVYANSLNNKLFWDDEVLIERNTYIKNWSYIPQIFSENIGAGGGEEYHFYRPLQMMTYMADHALWKLNVKGYHLTNILVHILAALSIFCLINAIFNDNALSFLTSIFFVVHPVHTEVVTYISGRADSLALLFMLLCFLFYVKSPPAGNAGKYILMLISYAAALLSKESSLVLPGLLLLYGYSFKKKLKGKEFFSLVSLAFVYILLRVTALKALLADVGITTTLFQRLPGFSVAVTNYLRLLFLPYGLHMDYGNRLFPWGDVKTILGAVLVIALLIVAFRKKNTDKLVFFSISWFFLSLLPVSNLYPINAFMAEHWLYAPSIGFFLAAAKAICSLYRVKDFRILTTMIVIGLLTFYSYLTVRQNTYWKEPLDFYNRTIKYSPNSMRVHFNLGRLYTDMGKLEEAAAAYKKAIEIRPDYAKAYGNLANVYFDMGKNAEAVAFFKKAIEIKPDYAKGYNNLGNVYSAMNKKEEAVSAYKKAVTIDGNYAGAYNNLGVVYADMHRNEEAIALYTKAIEIEPGYTNAYNNLGTVYKAMGRYEEAIAFFRKALETDPGYVIAYNNLGIIYTAVNQHEEAVAAYKKATEIKADYAEAYNNLGTAYSTIHKYPEAIASCRKAIEIDPGYALAYNNLAIIYLRTKQYPAAIDYSDRAEELGFTNPALSEALKPYR